MENFGNNKEVHMSFLVQHNISRCLGNTTRPRKRVALEKPLGFTTIPQPPPPLLQRVENRESRETLYKICLWYIALQQTEIAFGIKEVTVLLRNSHDQVLTEGLIVACHFCQSKHTADCQLSRLVYRAAWPLEWYGPNVGLTNVPNVIKINQSDAYQIC